MPRYRLGEGEEGVPLRQNPRLRTSQRAGAPMGEGEPALQGEEQGQEAPRRRRGGGQRQIISVGGKEYIRDGAWFVDKDVVDSYAAQGIDLLGQENPSDELRNAVEQNRMTFQQGVTRARREQVAAWNDQHWNEAAQQAGYTDWRQMRNALVNDPRFAELSEEDKAYYWGGGPGRWTNEFGLANRGAQQGGAPQAPPVSKPPIVGKGTQMATKQVNGVWYQQQPDGSWVKIDAPVTPAPAAPPVNPAPEGVPPLTTKPKPMSRLGGMAGSVPVVSGPAPLPQPKAVSAPQLAKPVQVPPTGGGGGAVGSLTKPPSMKPTGMLSGFKPPKTF